MKVRYPDQDQLKLLFRDTDTLAYAIKTEDIYVVLDANDLFDFNGYQDEHPCFASMSLDEMKLSVRSRCSPTGSCWATSKTVFAAIRRGAE